jgi:hypothetical protein
MHEISYISIRLSSRKKREKEKYKKLEYRPPSLPKGFIIILSQISNLNSNLITEPILGIYTLRDGGFGPRGSCFSLVVQRKRVGRVSVGREEESERGFGECEQGFVCDVGGLVIERWSKGLLGGSSRLGVFDLGKFCLDFSNFRRTEWANSSRGSSSGCLG